MRASWKHNPIISRFCLYQEKKYTNLLPMTCKKERSNIASVRMADANREWQRHSKNTRFDRLTFSEVENQNTKSWPNSLARPFGWESKQTFASGLNTGQLSSPPKLRMNRTRIVWVQEYLDGTEPCFCVNHRQYKTGSKLDDRLDQIFRLPFC